MKDTEDERIKHFAELTDKALSEEDIGKMIEFLVERNASIEYLMKMSVDISAESEEFLLKETKILERLENERKKLLNDMDELSRSRSVVKAYTPKFPFPPLSAFFEKKG